MGRQRSIWEQHDTEDITEKKGRTGKKWSRRHLGDKERDEEDLLDDPHKNGILKTEGQGGQEDAVIVAVVAFIFTSCTRLVLCIKTFLKNFSKSDFSIEHILASVSHTYSSTL
jgi:hypothetical protein